MDRGSRSLSQVLSVSTDKRCVTPSAAMCVTGPAASGAGARQHEASPSQACRPRVAATPAPSRVSIQRRTISARPAASPKPMRWPVNGATTSPTALKPLATTRIKPRLAAASTKIAGHRRVDANSTTCEAEPKTHPRPARPRAFTEKKPFRQRKTGRKPDPDANLLNAEGAPGGDGCLATPAPCRGTSNCRLALTNGRRSGLAPPVGRRGAPMGLEYLAQFKDLILGFVRDHGEWAAPIVFVLAFGESLAFISLIFPFFVPLFLGIGPLLGAADSKLDFWTIASAAALGAALGDWLSYWLGYHYHELISRMWPLSRYPNLLPNGHKFFARWGAWAIV